MTIKKTNKHFITITTILLAFLAAMSPFATDTYLSAMPSMASYFGVKINLIELTLTLYFLGFAVGNFFGGPLSDSFGRKTIALAGVVLYTISAGLIPFSSKIEYVWILRFTQAFGGGFASVTTMVFVKDWFEGKQVARIATIIGMIMMLAPLFAPVIGSSLLTLFNWQSIFYFMMSFAIILFIVFSLLMPESRDVKLITKKITLQQFVGNYKIFFTNKKAIYMLLAVSSSIAGLFTFLTGASFMYIEYYGYDQNIFPILFAANIISNVIISFFNTQLLKKYEPEQILGAGLALQLLAGLLFFITVLTSSVPLFWIVFFSVVLYIGSLGLVFGNSTAIILNLLPQISGSANALIGVSRFSFSFITGTLLAVFHSDNLFPISAIMFACAAIANVYFLFFKKS